MIISIRVRLQIDGKWQRMKFCHFKLSLQADSLNVSLYRARLGCCLGPQSQCPEISMFWLRIFLKKLSIISFLLKRGRYNLAPAILFPSSQASWIWCWKTNSIHFEIHSLNIVSYNVSSRSIILLLIGKCDHSQRQSVCKLKKIKQIIK